MGNLNAVSTAYCLLTYCGACPFKAEQDASMVLYFFFDTNSPTDSLTKNRRIPTFLSVGWTASAQHDTNPSIKLCNEGSTCLTQRATSWVLPITRWLLMLCAVNPLIVFSPLGGMFLTEAQHESRNSLHSDAHRVEVCSYTKETEPDSACETTLPESSSPLFFNLLLLFICRARGIRIRLQI